MQILTGLVGTPLGSVQVRVVWGSYLAMLRAYSRLWTQRSLLVRLEGPQGMPGITAGLAVCKADSLPTALPARLSLFSLANGGDGSQQTRTKEEA